MAVTELVGKSILLGVTGGIAAYKAIALVSLLVKSGADVHVALTEAAQQFVTPLPFQSLSKNPVIISLFDEPDPKEIAHIALVDRADLVVVAPATANFLAKAAYGLADDFLSTALLAAHTPVLLAPAMNVNMWNHPAVKANLAKLREFGFQVLEPATGQLACGWIGEGRLPEPEWIFAEIVRHFSEAKRLDYSGIDVLVTAGATREHLDPVRVLTNPSSGKMGYALAQAAVKRGARVTLISGPGQIPPQINCRQIQVTSALEMEQAVLEQLPEHQVLFMAAAVSDWRPAEYIPHKVKKTEGPMTVEFVRNPDILVSVSKLRTKSHVIVGFAAETENLVEFALEKLARKRLDFIVANDVSKPGQGFAADTNQVVLIRSAARIRELPLLSKLDTANEILDEVYPLIQERRNP